jgi:hippurate hydrolase
VAYTREFIPTINHEAATVHALGAATGLFDSVDADCPQLMGSEDFAHLLTQVPGNFAFIGNGVGCAPLHNPKYDYADNALPGTVAYLVALARRRLA